MSKVLTYRPKVEAYILPWTAKDTGEGVDVSDDIVSCHVERNLNAVSTASLQLNNKYKKYDRRFEPMDRIVIYMTRITRKKVFTGYLDSVPYYSMYPGTCNLKASCTLKRLLHTYWDKGLPSSIELINKHIATGLKESISGNDKVEGGIAYMAMDLMKRVGGWNEEMMTFMPFPMELMDVFVQKASGFQNYETLTEALFEGKAEDTETIRKILAQYFDVAGAGAGVGDGNVNGVPSEYVPIVNEFVNKHKSEGIPNFSRPLVCAIIEIESHWNSKAYNPEGDSSGNAKGLFQIKDLTFKGLADALGFDNIYTTRDIYDPRQNIHAGCQHLASALVDFNGNIDSAVRKRWCPATANKLPSIIQKYQEDDASLDNPQQSGSEVSTGGGSFSGLWGSGDGNETPEGEDPDGSRIFGTSQNALGLTATKFVNEALKFVGEYYAWGGGHNPPLSSPGGVDCSGLVNSAWKMANVGGIKDLTSQGWYSECQNNGQIVPFDVNLDAGHLVFSGALDHVGICIGNGYFVDSPDEGMKIRTGSMSSDLFTKAARHNMIGTSKVPGDPYATGSGGGASQSSDNMIRTAFNVKHLLPELMTQSMMLFGDKAMINDESLMVIIKELCTGTMRDFQSTPDGGFVAFFPDYVGAVFNRPYFILNDIEIKDLQLEWSDTLMSTHVFCAGDTTGLGQDPGLFQWMLSTGVVSIEQNQLMDFLVNMGDGETAAKTWEGWLQRFGARPYKKSSPWIGNPAFEYFFALQTFMRNWANMYASKVELTFMPDLFPGVRIGFDNPEFDLTVYVDKVTHDCSYGGEFTTTIRTTAPMSLGGEFIGLPRYQEVTPEEYEQRIAPKIDPVVGG